MRDFLCKHLGHKTRKRSRSGGYQTERMHATNKHIFLSSYCYRCHLHVLPPLSDGLMQMLMNDTGRKDNLDVPPTPTVHIYR